MNAVTFGAVNDKCRSADLVTDGSSNQPRVQLDSSGARFTFTLKCAGISQTRTVEVQQAVQAQERISLRAGPMEAIITFVPLCMYQRLTDAALQTAPRVDVEQPESIAPAAASSPRASPLPPATDVLKELQCGLNRVAVLIAQHDRVEPAAYTAKPRDLSEVEREQDTTDEQVREDQQALSGCAVTRMLGHAIECTSAMALRFETRRQALCSAVQHGSLAYEEARVQMDGIVQLATQVQQWQRSEWSDLVRHLAGATAQMQAAQLFSDGWWDGNQKLPVLRSATREMKEVVQNVADTLIGTESGWSHAMRGATLAWLRSSVCLRAAKCITLVERAQLTSMEL
jgi:hypothetical protein